LIQNAIPAAQAHLPTSVVIKKYNRNHILADLHDIMQMQMLSLAFNHNQPVKYLIMPSIIACPHWRP